MFATKITINSADVDAILNNYKNKIGKIEFDFSEIIFLNEQPNDWESSEKKMKTVISLLDSGTSFELLADKFSDLNPQGNKLKTGWIFEDSLDSDTKEILNNMSPGDVKTNIKINNGFKIIKVKLGDNGKKDVERIKAIRECIGTVSYTHLTLPTSG